MSGRRRELAYGTAGVVATAVGIGLFLVPDLLLGIGPVAWAVRSLTAVDATTLGLVAGVLATLYLGWSARSQPASETVSAASRSETRFEMAATAPPETVTAQRQRLAAGWVDDDVEEAIEHGGDALAETRSQLRSTATHAYATAADVTPEAARAAVDGGEWTADRMAATFLAGPEGPSASLGARLRLWLFPARERRRRIERSITAIETTEGR